MIIFLSVQEGSVLLKHNHLHILVFDDKSPKNQE